MPTNTYVELDRVTLLSNGGPVTFSNIPQTYTDLRIVIQGGFVDSGFMIGARVGNGTVDSAGNYSYQTLRGSGSVASATRKTNMIFGAFCQQGGNNLNNVITVDFFNYSSTTKHKSWISRYGNGGEGTDTGVSLWRSTAAINTISIAECGDGGTGAWNYGNMLSGTTFSLYGIRAEGVSPTTKATGGAVYSDDVYYYHVFGASGTFTPTQSITADVLVVAGGGGGGDTVGGGGGAGGLLAFTSQSLTATNYTVTVGSGGAAGSGFNGSGKGGLGGDSQFGSLTLVKGGGGGGDYTNAGGGGLGGTGLTGGSGGGGGVGTTSGGAGGSATSGQGNAGGSGAIVGTNYPAGGGGGAGAVGANAASNVAGNGGNGLSTYSSWGAATGTGENVSGTYYYAGGGGGAQSTNRALGGLGGGGLGGSNSPAIAGAAGLAASGGGGGGGRDNLAGRGGSGVVIVRYAK